MIISLSMATANLPLLLVCQLHHCVGFRAILPQRDDTVLIACSSEAFTSAVSSGVSFSLLRLNMISICFNLFGGISRMQQY